MNHQDLVVRIKAQLEARGVNLSGACGAFEITKRVAAALRGEGAGLLDKPSGNNCSGYAVDIIAYQDGAIVDILGDAGNANNPSWGTGDHVDPARWRPAFQVDAEPVPGPAPVPIPPASPTDPKLLELLNAIMAALGAQSIAAQIRHAEILNGLDRIHAEQAAGYVGTARIPYIGNAPIDLKLR